MNDRAMELALEEKQDYYFYLMMHLMQDSKAEQLLQQKGSGKPSPEHAARILGLAEDHLRKENRKIAFRKVYSIAQKAAVFLVAFLFAGSVVVVNVEAFREVLSNWILHWGQKNMMIVSDMDAAPAETARYSCVFGWLPEGCTLVRSVYEEMEVSYTVYRNNEAAGSIRIMPLDAVQLNDTDGASIEYPQIYGFSEIIYFEKDYGEIEVSRRLIAQNDDCKIRIDNQIGTVSSLSKEEIYQILENLDIVTEVGPVG